MLKSVKSPYYQTLAGAIEATKSEMLSRGLSFTNESLEYFEEAFVYGGIGYDETKRGSFNVEKNGKLQKKCWQVIIYRMGSGRYELTDYLN
jgi:hypothetical protein